MGVLGYEIRPTLKRISFLTAVAAALLAGCGPQPTEVPVQMNVEKKKVVVTFNSDATAEPQNPAIDACLPEDGCEIDFVEPPLDN